jgi:hypothetical protein
VGGGGLAQHCLGQEILREAALNFQKLLQHKAEGEHLIRLLEKQAKGEASGSASSSSDPKEKRQRKALGS